MYIPHKFRITEWDEITRFAQSVRAADLVTVMPDGTPISTLMPFLWDQSEISEGSYGTLVMHMARANPQWKSITPESKALAIVRGQQAYISPTNYANKFTDHKVVPTWNYQSLHLTGTVEISEDVELLRQIVTDLTAFHEQTRANPWAVAESDPTYLELELKGIIAVTLKITTVEAKYKLGQNKSIDDHNRVIADLQHSEHAGESAIASEMKRLRP
jgi:transcriptional regulator